MDTIGKVQYQLENHESIIAELTQKANDVLGKVKQYEIDLKCKNNKIRDLERQIELNDRNANPIGVDSIPDKIPGTGDHVVAMWGKSKWQYFTATIVGFERESLSYTIDWDDNDPTGREIHYSDIDAVYFSSKFCKIGATLKQILKEFYKVLSGFILIRIYFD